MKYSTFTTLAGLLGLGSASVYTEHVDVVCTDLPYTVTETVTVTEGGYGGDNGHYTPTIITEPPYTATEPPYVVTNGPTVTSVDYDGDKTSVWVYPTGSPNHDCTVAIYEKNVVTVVIINVSVTVINGYTSTVTSTVHDYKPTWTPTPPPKTTTYSIPAEPTYYPAIHTVIVGANGELKYGPSELNAKIGDIIRFDFNSTNHTVTQSSFKAPCTPREGGFNTGFNQVNKENHTGIIFRDFEVKVDTPLWFYCAQTVKVSHCHKGMVLGVNSNGTFPEFLDRATNTKSLAASTGASYSSTPIYSTSTPVYNTLPPYGTGYSTSTPVYSTNTKIYGTGSSYYSSSTSTPVYHTDTSIYGTGSSYYSSSTSTPVYNTDTSIYGTGSSYVSSSTSSAYTPYGTGYSSSSSSSDGVYWAKPTGPSPYYPRRAAAWRA